MDIQKTLQKLHEAKVRDRIIAEKIGICRPAVTFLRHGRTKTTFWEVGEKLRLFALSKGCLVDE